MASEQARARNRGKAFERLVAKALGGFRPAGGNRGLQCSDIGGVPWSVEATRTAQVRKRLWPKWEQACVNAGLEGREPVLVAAYPRQRLGDAVVMMRFSLFQQLREASDEEKAADGIQPNE